MNHNTKIGDNQKGMVRKWYGKPNILIIDTSQDEVDLFVHQMTREGLKVAMSGLIMDKSSCHPWALARF